MDVAPHRRAKRLHTMFKNSLLIEQNWRAFCGCDEPASYGMVFERLGY
jgi:hypothetical protein